MAPGHTVLVLRRTSIGWELLARVAVAPSLDELQRMALQMFQDVRWGGPHQAVATPAPVVPGSEVR